jgi:hypothetical protein
MRKGRGNQSQLKKKKKTKLIICKFRSFSSRSLAQFPFPSSTNRIPTTASQQCVFMVFICNYLAGWLAWFAH